MLSLIKKTVTDAAHTLPFAAQAARDGEASPLLLTASGALVLDKLTGAARTLCVAPDATLLSGSDDGGLRAWNTSSGRLMSQTKAFETDVAGGVGALGSVVDGCVGRGVFIDGWARARARFNHRARHDDHGWSDVCDRGDVRVTEEWTHRRR